MENGCKACPNKDNKTQDTAPGNGKLQLYGNGPMSMYEWYKFSDIAPTLTAKVLKGDKTPKNHYIPYLTFKMARHYPLVPKNSFSWQKVTPAQEAWQTLILQQMESVADKTAGTNGEGATSTVIEEGTSAATKEGTSAATACTVLSCGGSCL